MTLGRGATFEGVDYRPIASPGIKCRGSVGELSGESPQGGHTLLEMIIVVAIIGIIAAVALPYVTPQEHHKLSLAASTVADAIRFAREEARHTGVVHGVATNLTNNTVRVFRLDKGPDPNLKVFDVYQPVSKQLYTIQVGAPPYSNVVISAVGGQLVGSCSDPGNIAFDSGGVVRCVEPVATRIRGASVELALGELRQSVYIDEYTGRVSVQ